MRTSLLLRLLILLVLLLACDVSSGQQSAGPAGTGAGRPIEGAAGLPNQKTSPRSDLQAGIRMHLDTFGKPCVAIMGYSIPKADFRTIFGAGQSSELEQKVSKPKIFENFISAQNHCGQPIKFRVCYYASPDCVPVDVPGYGNQRVSLGVSAGTPGFRYQYTEQF